MTGAGWDDGEGGSWLLPFLQAVAPREWMARANCRGTASPSEVNVFFPETRDDRGNRRVPLKGELERSKEPCRDCPVTVECAEYAQAIGAKDGTWGGKDELERRRRPRRRTGSRSPSHGNVTSTEQRTEEVAVSTKAAVKADAAKKAPAKKTANREVPSRRGNAKYPWDKWTDGKQHTIEQGKDFDLDPQVMRASVLRRAWAMGKTAETSVDGKKVTFKVKERMAKDKKS